MSWHIISISFLKASNKLLLFFLQKSHLIFLSNLLEPFILLFFLHSHAVPKSVTNWTIAVANTYCSSSEICWIGDSFWWTKVQNVKNSFRITRSDVNFTFTKTWIPPLLLFIASWCLFFWTRFLPIWHVTS